MATFDPRNLLRKHLTYLKPYASARDEYTGKEGIFLDANENSLGSATEASYQRYPDPYQRNLKTKIGAIKGIDPSYIFLGNGSDEPIDLIYRAFCEPGHDQVVLMPPTYGMYEVSANIHNVGMVKIPLSETFQIDLTAVLSSFSDLTKVVWICSPNNPTGNLLNEDDILKILDQFHGLVVVDEAYIDFATIESWSMRLDQFPNLIVLQTFSKAWGMAAIRLGMAFASPQIIAILNQIKSPYNISLPVQKIAEEALDHLADVEKMVGEILDLRSQLVDQLIEVPIVQQIFPSDANFVLAKFDHAQAVYDFLIEKKIIIRNRSNVIRCEGGLRITVGTREENEALLAALKSFSMK